MNIWFDFDTSGAIINALLYPVSVSYFSWSFCKQTSQNEMLFVIGTNDTNSGTSYNHIVLFKADSAGDIKWAKRIGGVKTDYPAFVLQTSDHGIGVLGATQNFTNGALSIYFVKTDSIGNSNCNIDTFHINQLAPVTVALSDNKVVSIVSNTNNSIPVTVNSIINDSIFDDCICHKPHANFVFYQSGMGSPSTSSDGSTWATHWYWSFGDGTYDSVDITPIHQYKDTGSYNVCLTVKNACAVDSLCQVLFYPDTTLGIKTITDNNKINVFPNPSKGLFNFQFEKMNQKGEIEIYNMLGKQVYNETLRQVQGDVRIDLSGQPAGIYLYRIISENGKAIASGKLVIQ